MSKVTKILCLVAAGLVAFGLALAGFAYLLGANTSIPLGPWDRYYDDYDESDGYDSARMTVNKEDVDSFHSLDLDVDYQEVTLREGDSFHIDSSYDERFSTVFYEVKDGVLTLKETSKHRRRGFPWNMANGKRPAGRLTITYPQGTELTSVFINCDMSGVYVDDMIVGDLKLEVDLGSVELTRVQAGTLQIDADMGNITLEDSSADRAEFNCDLGSVESDNFLCRQSLEADASAGNIDLSGDFQGITKIKCDLGNIKLSLMGKSSDYGYSIETDLGNLEIDGRSMGTHSSSKGGPHYLEIFNSAGNVDVRFDRGH